MQDVIKLSIVLCTYNNADSLKITLDQLCTQVCDTPNHVEVLVIDNNSPDHTKKVSEEFVAHSKIAARYIFESRQGLSHARNTGVSNARGEHILFTDDDAGLPEHWIQTYLDKINQYNPDCLYSKIQIIWDQPKPRWYLPQYNPCFVILDYGNQQLSVQDLHKEFYGKNFAMRKSLINELGGFDPALGRNGSKLIAGEETLLYRQMIATGKKVIYFPEAPVGHRLKEREYTEANIKKVFIDGAYSAHHIAKLTATKKIFGRPLRALVDYSKTLLRSSFYFCLYKIKGNKPLSFFHSLNCLKSLTFLKLWVTNQ